MNRAAAALILLALAPACDRRTAPAPASTSLTAAGTGAVPLPSAGSATAVPLPPAGSGKGAASLTWTVPEGWTEEPPSSRMRKAQYRVPGAAGPAELVVYYFGPSQGGDARANAERWAGQFTQPDGRPSTEVMKTARRTVGAIDVLTVEVAGTYSGGMPMAPGPAKAGWMLLGAVAEGPDANWFFKLTGPADTVEARRAGFEALLGSLKPGG